MDFETKSKVTLFFLICFKWDKIILLIENVKKK